MSLNGTIPTFTDTFPMSVIAVPAQAVDATQALNRSAGVWKPKVLRGRSLNYRATLLSCGCVYTDRSVPLGKYCRSSPLVFSLDPRWRRRSRLALTLREREEISRGIAAARGTIDGAAGCASRAAHDKSSSGGNIPLQCHR